MTLPVSGSVIGCRPSSERSMIARRRKANAAWLDCQNPSESGPRWAWHRLMTRAISANAGVAGPMMPAMPHMVRAARAGFEDAPADLPLLDPSRDLDATPRPRRGDPGLDVGPQFPIPREHESGIRAEGDEAREGIDQGHVPFDRAQPSDAHEG